jgi:hypothetical protein
MGQQQMHGWQQLIILSCDVVNALARQCARSCMRPPAFDTKMQQYLQLGTGLARPSAQQYLAYLNVE